MSKTCIIYGSSTGTCQSIAEKIAEKLGVDSADVFDVANIEAGTPDAYDSLLLGTSTWGAGELQDDWYDGLETLKGANLAGKTIAIFGCGDSESYSDTFCSAMAEIHEGLKDSGAKFVGAVSTDGYTYDDSAAVVDGKFIGLALDDVNEDDKTDERIDAWVADIKGSL
ncbi:MAG: flavodoxin FldA [Prevotellaceae bacterium]|nr:flavodoxin FldA [Prevotellaceae bacterium]